MYVNISVSPCYPKKFGAILEPQCLTLAFRHFKLVVLNFLPRLFWYLQFLESVIKSETMSRGQPHLRLDSVHQPVVSLR